MAEKPATEMRPKDMPPALSRARKIAGGHLPAIVALRTLATVARLGFAAAMGVFAGVLVQHQDLRWDAAAAGIATILVGLALNWLADRRAVDAEAVVASDILSQVEATLSETAVGQLAGLPRGAMVSGVQRHPGALAALVVSHAVASRMLGLGPLAVIVAVALASWEAALALLLAMPVMIGFFVLVGGLIRERADMQEEALQRLAAQFADRVRALPTILANHALAGETHKLGSRLQAYASGTMGVLSIAFLNSGILDFFSSLAIAVLAVFLGLGHLGLAEIPGFAHLALSQSLFILLVAPEFFAPLRRYAEFYHAKAEGEAAAQALTWAFEPGEPNAALPAVDDAIERALAGFDWPSRGLVAITGPSGVGKTRLLRRLAGVDERGALPMPAQAPNVGWIATDSYVPAGTLLDALAWGLPSIDRDEAGRVAGQLGLIDEAALPGRLDAAIAVGGENLSGGQRIRVAVARLLLGSGTAFCDEPTAKLDARNAERVRHALRDAARTRLVIVTTHDEGLIRLADRRIALAPLPMEAVRAAE
ncbi:ABC transporter transmembrane domain-containing protein [Consotaella aegiceratis]|uniref:ABC transporter transmembrane domain-containing protein n=1 Tax=Consotaella aegiceratis TaxID=3097961 RepID=UPI002F412D9D